MLDLLVTSEVAPREELEDVKVILTLDEFNKLEKINLEKNIYHEYESKECNVCIESYREGDQLVKLPCHHCFHEECIKHWLCNENVKCPVCRSDTRNQSVSK
jgi:hypothetical protein